MKNLYERKISIRIQFSISLVSRISGRGLIVQPRTFCIFDLILGVGGKATPFLFLTMIEDSLFVLLISLSSAAVAEGLSHL